MDSSRALADRIAAAVAARLGRSDLELGNVVAEELAAVLGAGGGAAPSRGGEVSRVVVTANGRNRPGVVARLATVIDEHGGDIRDLSQTIVGDYFTMLFVVDLREGSAEGAHFARLRHDLVQAGEDLGVHVLATHDDIFSAMHEI